MKTTRLSWRELIATHWYSSLLMVMLVASLVAIFYPPKPTDAAESTVVSDNCIKTATIKAIEWYWCDGENGSPDFLGNTVGFTVLEK